MPHFGAAEISQVQSGRTHKKISYSGSGLGNSVTQIQDIIFFTIPSGTTLDSITINFGSDAAWRKLQVVSYGWSTQDHKTTPGLGAIQQVFQSYVGLGQPVTINRSPDANGNVNLQMGHPVANAKYMYVHIRTTGQIGGRFGAAEGYAISSIQCAIRGASTVQTFDPIEGEDIYEDFEESQQYTAFPSLIKPELNAVAEYYLKGTSALYYDGNNLKSNTNPFYLYTIDDDEFWEWNGSTWNNVEPEDGNVDVVIKDESATLTFDVDAVVTALDSGKFNNLNSTKPISTIYDTQSIKSKSVTFNKIYYNYLEKQYEETFDSSINIKTSSYKSEASTVEFDLTKPIFVNLSNNQSVTIENVVTETGSSFDDPLSAISISYSGADIPPLNKPTRFTLATSAAYYSGSNVITTNPNYISNYSMKNISGNIVPKKESVTVLDGVILLCDSTGKPIGIPNGSEISSYFGTSILDQEKDSRLGFVFVRNKIETSNGLIFGFYDIQQKEFLGEKIAFVDILLRGIKNVYLAVCAIDSDGNSQNAIDYIGPKVSTTFLPIDVPVKRICPVYSVAFKASSAIKIGNITSFTDKKEAWSLPIASGSFVKEIEIPTSNKFTDWKSNYLGQDLLATYDTSSFPTNWSPIFGRGYYHIKNEKPIIVSDKQIKVRQTPFLIWPEPSSYEFSQVEIFRPQFEIYTRESEELEWSLVQFSEIRDYNSHSGIIEFNNRIVPEDENLIKINYVKKSTDIQVYQVGGEPIPLNPFLNSETIKLNKGLYIYVLPTKINKLSNLSDFNSYIPIEEYENEYPIGFTYDPQIFNSNSINYDPFALPIGIIYFLNNPKKKQTQISDTRLRGGGIKSNIGLLDMEESMPKAIFHWDIYPSYGTTYPKGGFVIVKIPEKVKENFQSVEEIYEIVRSNLTAGVSFEIQDLNGKPWEI